MSARLIELIEQLSARAFDPRVLDALTEIDRRLTALEERTAPPFSGNEVTANLLRAAEEARAKAVEDGLAVLEGRTTITCTCHRIDSWDGTVRGFEPIDGCAMHGNRPEDVAAREAFAEAWKARKQGAESEPAQWESAPEPQPTIPPGVIAGESMTAEQRAEVAKQHPEFSAREIYQGWWTNTNEPPTEDEPVTAGQRAAALVMLGPEIRAAREWPTELARALSEAVSR